MIFTNYVKINSNFVEIISNYVEIIRNYVNLQISSVPLTQVTGMLFTASLNLRLDKSDNHIYVDMTNKLY